MRIVNVLDYGGIGKAKAAGVIYCGRPSPLGNPFSHLDCKGTIKVATRDDAIERYRYWLWDRIKLTDPKVLGALHQLKDDSIIGCWCKPLRCHCEIIEKAWVWLTTGQVS